MLPTMSCTPHCWSVFVVAIDFTYVCYRVVCESVLYQIRIRALCLWRELKVSKSYGITAIELYVDTVLFLLIVLAVATNYRS